MNSSDRSEQTAMNSGQKARDRLKPMISLGQYIGPEECPYMRRWLIQNRWGTLRLHHFLRSDDERALHDHPRWFITLVIKGKYTDVTAKGRDELHWFSVRFRPARHIHRVETDGAWTLVITGPWERHWGFWNNGVFSRWKAFLGEHGFAACQEIEQEAQHD